MDGITFLLGLLALGVLNYYHAKKLEKTEEGLLQLLIEQLLKSGWSKDETFRVVELHQLHTRKFDGVVDPFGILSSPSHTDIAWKNKVTLTAAEQSNLVARLRRSIEMIGFMKGWEIEELSALSDRMLSILDEDEERRKLIIQERTEEWGRREYQKLVRAGKLE